jgi:hypothetical protein
MNLPFPLYILILVVILGLLSSYLLMINYLKKLRSGQKTPKPIEMALSCAFFGGPVLLLFYIFSDFRLEDSLHKRVFLISGIIETVLQGLLIFLLIYFKVFA